ncbi:hypothetical protein [Streptomyces sp. SLBN-8D4]|uniref:hypothetical protein n=1 Tax=Streptomyces sp. SLBN-8D4 TaxID=3377728 RepID=UPI003C7B5029
MAHVRGYHRADGTWVSPHWRSDPVGAGLADESDGSSIWYWVMGFTALALLHLGLALTADASYLAGFILFGAADAGCLYTARRIRDERRAQEAERARRQRWEHDLAEQARNRVGTYGTDLAAGSAERQAHWAREWQQWQTPDGRPGPYAPTGRPPRPTCHRCGTQKHGHPGAEVCFWCGA